jgi:hypothetical protein
MIIDVVVPARTPQMDYLHHPECDASKVAVVRQNAIR